MWGFWLILDRVGDGFGLSGCDFLVDFVSMYMQNLCWRVYVFEFHEFMWSSGYGIAVFL